MPLPSHVLTHTEVVLDTQGWTDFLREVAAFRDWLVELERESASRGGSADDAIAVVLTRRRLPQPD